MEQVVAIEKEVRTKTHIHKSTNMKDNNMPEINEHLTSYTPELFYRKTSANKKDNYENWYNENEF